MSFPDTQIKGSILVGSGVVGAASMTPLPAGPDGQVLTADSTTPTGLKYAPAGAGSDIYAATRVVSLIAGDGTDLTIAAAIAALPAAGGHIYIKQGTYPLVATNTLPDKPVVIRGSGDGTILSLGASVIAAFTMPDGLTAQRNYVFEDFLVTGTSVANQRIWSVQESNALAIVQARRVNSSGIQIPTDITDGVAAEPVTISMDDCHFAPIADGSSVLINTPDLTGITVNAWLQRVRFYDEYTDVITGALTNDDGITPSGVNILGEDCVFSIGTDSAVSALALFNSHIYNLGPGANPVISINDDNFGVTPSCLVGCSGQFVNFSIFGNGTHVYGGAYRACSFTDGAISFFTDVYFFADLTADAAVILSTSSTFIKGCYFDNQGTAFVLDGAFNTIVGNFFASSGVGLTATIRTTNGAAAIADNRFVSATAPAILEAGTVSTNNINNNRWVTDPTLLDDSDAIVNGFKRKNIDDGATVDALTAVFTHINDKGLAGAGSIKNTGANSLTVRRTVTDGYGTTDFQEDAVPAGTSFQWPMDTTIGTALAAYVSFTVSVRSTGAGLPTTYDLRHSSTGAY